MKKKIFAIFKYIIFLAIGGVLVWWQVSEMTDEEQNQFIDSLQNARYIYLIPIVIMGLLSHYFRALRWKLLIQPFRNVSSGNAFYATLIGYLGNTFVPRAGEVLRCSVLGRYEKTSVSRLIGTVIIERTFDLLCYIFFILLTVLVQLDIVGNFAVENSGKIFSQSSGLPVWTRLLLLLFTLALAYFVMNWFFKKYGSHKIVRKIRQLRNELIEGLSTILQLRKKKSFLFYTLLIWLMYLLQIYLGFRTLDATMHLGIGAAMSVLALSTIAMIISPGGLGAFPIAVQQVLLVYHVNNISFGWLVWGVNTAMIIIAGIISFIIIIYQNGNTNEKNRQDTRQDIHPAGT